MKWILSLFLCTFTGCLYANSVSHAQFAYVANYYGDNISIVDLVNNVTVGYVNNGPFTITHPDDILFTPDGTKAYVIADISNAVFVIDPTQNLIVKQVNDNGFPFSGPSSIDFSVDGTKAYVTNEVSNHVSIIDTATDTVTGYINDGGFPFDLPISVQFSTITGSKAYVTNYNGNNVSVIDTATDTVTGYVTEGSYPFNSPDYIGMIDDTKVYITNLNAVSDAAVSVIDLSTDTVTGYVNPASYPFGGAQNLFISFDHLTAYIEDDTTNQISIVNISTNTVTDYINAAFQDPDCFHLSFDETLLYVVNRASSIIGIIDLETNTQIGVVSSTQFPLNTPVAIDLSNFIIAPAVLALLEAPTAPLGIKREKRFLTQTELINVVTWAPPLGNRSPVSYAIYRDAALTDLAAMIPVSAPLQFVDHNRHKKHIYNYYIVAIYSGGLVSSPAVVTLTW